MTPDRLLQHPLRVINIGLEVVAQEREAEGVEGLQVDWRPPAGDPSVTALLERLAADDQS